eukprot:Phypoly_transcript_10794.p1 GENE.Phypoly_transcript_10794~~Phypoly_transcript_10794.p1  ORF type:complete len:321 (+),score=34.90 Phypoly_transcript_10794:158-1120(+)
MGISLCKSQVFRPDIIQAQLLMQNFTMVKMFLSAALVSTTVIQFLSSQQFIFLAPSTRSWAKNVAGGLLLGVAMFITGACPGTVLAQVGPGIKSAQYTLLGGIVGGMAYGFLHPYISKIFPKPSATAPASVDSVLKIPRSLATAILVGGFASVLTLLEYIRPWQVDAGVPLSLTSLASFGLFSPVWSPYVGGALIGLLQIPSFLMIESGLGCSSGYVSLISHTFGESFAKSREYFGKFYGTALGTWQLFFDVGIIFGSGLCFWALKSQASSLAHLPAIPSLVSILGGFLLIFGARIADGCTSGHGLTGMGKLSGKSSPVL